MCVSSAFSKNDERALRSCEQVEGAIDRFRGRKVPWCWIDNPHQRVGPGIGVECSAKDVGGQVQVDAARTPGYGSMNRACDSNTDVFGPVDPEGRFCVGLSGFLWLKPSLSPFLG